MEEKGKIYQILPAEGGVSKAGREWRRQTVVMEFYSRDNTMRRLAITTPYNDVMERLEKLAPGDEATVTYSVSSREYSGRWYTDVTLRLIKSDKLDEDTPTPEPEKRQEDLPF